MKIIPLAACLLLGLVSTVAEAAKPRRATAPGGALKGLVTADDYPIEAQKNEEQGTVLFRLGVGPDGKPTHCAVESSSGSASLDSTTCRLMMERARFDPALDRRGRPTKDEITSRITWRLVEEPPPRVGAAMMLWSSCLAGEAAKLAVGNLSPAEIAARAYAPCTALESLLKKEAEKPVVAEEWRLELTKNLEKFVARARDGLNAPKEEEVPEQP